MAKHQYKQHIVLGIFFIMIACALVFWAIPYTRSDQASFWGGYIDFIRARLQDGIFLSDDTNTVEEKNQAPKVIQEHQADLDKEVTTLSSLVREAAQVYDDDERSRKEGSLWVDRALSKYVITLGAIHGLYKGDRVFVYEGTRKLGSAALEEVFDAISYVSIPDGMTLSDKNYYTVKAEE